LAVLNQVFGNPSADGFEVDAVEQARHD
jgi:hypothetical protein